jgi:hypothetical protein
MLGKKDQAAQKGDDQGKCKEEALIRKQALLFLKKKKQKDF